MVDNGEVSEVVIRTVNCPYCHDSAVVKNGKGTDGKQRYKCKPCSKRFLDTGAVHGRKNPQQSRRRGHQPAAGRSPVTIVPSWRGTVWSSLQTRPSRLPFCQVILVILLTNACRLVLSDWRRPLTSHFSNFRGNSAPGVIVGR